MVVRWPLVCYSINTTNTNTGSYRALIKIYLIAILFNSNGLSDRIRTVLDKGIRIRRINRRLYYRGVVRSGDAASNTYTIAINRNNASALMNTIAS